MVKSPNSIPFPSLNLPPAPLTLTQSKTGRWLVYDPLRRRRVTLTAEEWVRQHFVHYLVAELGFPLERLANEVAVRVGTVSRRCDMVFFSREGARPLLLFEYKAPHIPITESVFQQIQSYNSILRVPYLVVSNGLQHIVCHLDYKKQNVKFLREIPTYSSLKEEI